jgi:large subunit ribosomal protein L22
MEAKAVNRYIGTSPRKMRLVIDLIRGKGVEEALTVLHFVPKHAAKAAEKVLRSAISNYQNKDEAGRVDTATLFVKTAFVNGGPMAKRILPAPMGRAFRVRKRSNHVTIVIAQRDGTKSGKKKTVSQKSNKVVEEKQPVTTAS